MGSKLIRFAGSHVAQKALQKHSGAGGALDLKFGSRLLFRDKTIPIRYKLLAIGLGVALTAALVAMETPLEAILGTLLPVFGWAADLFVDGLELIVCPVLFAALMLPHIAPRAIVDNARFADSEILPVSAIVP